MSRGHGVAIAAAFTSMAVVFVAKTLADTAFLAEYGPHLVPHFFVAQAALLVAGSFAYTALIRRKSPLAPDLAILGVLAALTAAAPLLLARGGPWVFAVSLALVAVSALAQIAVWNAAVAVVHGRAHRTFVPRAGGAATAGAVAGGFGSSGVVAALGVDALGPAAATLVIAQLVMRVSLERRAHRSRPPRTPPARISKRAPRRLVQLLIAAAIAEAVLASVVDFGFKAELSAVYDRHDMGVFFALFYGGTNLLILLLQVGLASRLLTALPLRLTMSLEPLSLAVTSALWVVAPGLALAAVARSAEGAGKFALARPAQEIALTPLSDRARRRVKVLLRGAFNQIGAATAGVLLIVAAPVFEGRTHIIPAVALALAVASLAIHRAAGRRYLDALGSALGTRRLSVRNLRSVPHIDREALGHVVELTGSVDPEVASFGRELLADVDDPTLIANHLGHGDPAVRATLYELLARNPHGAALPALRAAVLAEPDGSPALADGLGALAVLGDDAAVDLARELAVADGEPARAAQAYLARVGALDDEHGGLERVAADLLIDDGDTAADVLGAALARGALDEQAIDRLVTAAVEADPPQPSAFHAAAALGRSKPLVALLKAIEAGEPRAVAALGHLDSAGVGRLAMLANARNASPEVRARILRGLRRCAATEVVDVALPALLDDDFAVREQAARTLLRRLRGNDHLGLPEERLEEAIAFELDALAVYLRARPHYPAGKRDSSIVFRHDALATIDAEEFFADELERRAERSLSRLCGVLALRGGADVVFAAERELRAPTLARRRLGVDILQEVARGAERPRLFDLLELYLRPSGGDDAARRAACEMDAWLTRCASEELAPLRNRLYALRSSVVFDAVPGEELIELAEAATEGRADKGELIVEAGDTDAGLVIVTSGMIALERDGRVFRKLPLGAATGELGVADGAAWTSDVRAMRAASYVTLPRSAYRAARAEHPELAIGLVRGLARLLRESTANA